MSIYDDAYIKMSRCRYRDTPFILFNRWRCDDLFRIGKGFLYFFDDFFFIYHSLAVIQDNDGVNDKPCVARVCPEYPRDDSSKMQPEDVRIKCINKPESHPLIRKWLSSLCSVCIRDIDQETNNYSSACSIPYITKINFRDYSVDRSSYCYTPHHDSWNGMGCPSVVTYIRSVISQF